MNQIEMFSMQRTTRAAVVTERAGGRRLASASHATHPSSATDIRHRQPAGAQPLSYERGSLRSMRGGFSLIELLLVLVILAVLAAVVAPRFAQRGEQARVTAAETQISQLETALEAFEVDTGRFPTNEEGLRALTERPSGMDTWRGPYMGRSVPRDPWGNEYIYRYPGQNNDFGFDLSSRGPDGQEGTDDDIGNW